MCCSFFGENRKQNRRVSSRQTPYSFAGPKEYAEKDLSPCGGHLLCPFSETSRNNADQEAGPLQGASRQCFLDKVAKRHQLLNVPLKKRSSRASSTRGEAYTFEKHILSELMSLYLRAKHSPLLRASFLLLRFLCRHKENEVAVGQPRRF